GVHSAADGRFQERRAERRRPHEWNREGRHRRGITPGGRMVCRAEAGAMDEADTVPKTMVGQGRMRFLQPGGGTEPIGSRIITVPQDQERARSRDPKSGFVAYVPVGSIAKGKALAESGGAGRSVACTICHGDTFKGLGNVPRLAGLHPAYIARQLYLFKDGRRNGVDAQLMKK